MASPTFSVGGLVSGLDTDAIVRKLLDVERIPINRLGTRKAAYKAKMDAWGQIRAKLATLRTSVESLKRASDFAAMSTAVSSNDAAVGARATGAAPGGPLAFTVDRLAATHRIAAAGTFAGPDALVGAGTFTITRGDTTIAIDTTESTTLEQLARAVDQAGAGVTASVVSVDGSAVRLVLAATTGGEAAAFGAAGTQASLASFDVVEQGIDAQLTIGSGAGAITVTRASNVVSDLIEGVTLTLKATTASPVSISTGRDLDAAVTRIKDLVAAVNGALDTIGTQTRYDAATKTGGPLQGETAAWRLALSLRQSVSDAVGGLGATTRSAASLGVTLGRDGRFALDEAALRRALESDFDGAVATIARAGTVTDARASFAGASDATVPGTYDVVVTQAATRGGVTGAAYVAPLDAIDFTIAAGGKTAAVTVAAGDDVSTALARINEALSAAGITWLQASEDAGAIRIQSARYGSASFVVDGAADLVLDGTFAGLDVAGTIDGAAATGAGQTLTASGGDAGGLAVRVTASDGEIAAAGGSLALGSVTYTSGFAGRVSAFVQIATGAGGTIDRADDQWTAQIRVVDREVDRLTGRLDAVETRLRRQFSAMESALSALSAQASWLSQQIGSLSG